jgi:hypothetical protein
MSISHFVATVVLEQLRHTTPMPPTPCRTQPVNLPELPQDNLGTYPRPGPRFQPLPFTRNWHTQEASQAPRMDPKSC